MSDSQPSGIVGEFGELLMPGAAGYILAGEAPVNASPGDVVALLRRVIARPDLPIAAREYALTSLMKLSARLPGVVPSVQASRMFYVLHVSCASLHSRSVSRDWSNCHSSVGALRAA